MQQDIINNFVMAEFYICAPELVFDWDPLSWNVGWGVTFRFAGWFGHTSYFNSENVNNVANIVNEYIN